MLSDQAVRPLGESKGEWEIFGLLTEQISARAKERGVTTVRGFRDRPLDLSKAYAQFTSNGRFDPHDPMDPVQLIDDIMRKSPSVGGISGEEALRLGAVRIVGPARPTPIYATYSDYDPKDTHWPHRWFVDQKLPWPTLTGRQQFYLDHEWYLEAGEALPVHKDHPEAKSRFPLRINGGHTRWSIHAIWRDHDLMLRLQRGEPVCFLSPVDCAPRGVSDGDDVRVYNDVGAFEAMAKVTPRVQPGRGDHLPRLGAVSVQELEGPAGARGGAVEADPSGGRLRPAPLPDVLRLPRPRPPWRSGRGREGDARLVEDATRLRARSSRGASAYRCCSRRSRTPSEGCRDRRGTARRGS